MNNTSRKTIKENKQDNKRVRFLFLIKYNTVKYTIVNNDIFTRNTFYLQLNRDVEANQHPLIRLVIVTGGDDTRPVYCENYIIFPVCNDPKAQSLALSYLNSKQFEICF